VHPQVNAIANKTIRELSQKIGLTAINNPIKAEMSRRISNFYAHPEQFKVISSPKIPDGSPIGMACFN
jgi:hypothetical protein